MHHGHHRYRRRRAPIDGRGLAAPRHDLGAGPPSGCEGAPAVDQLFAPLAIGRRKPSLTLGLMIAWWGGAEFSFHGFIDQATSNTR